MTVAIVTGAGGLIGSQAMRHFAALGLHVVGIDNDMRGQFFGGAASVAGNLARLARDLPDAYLHTADIRDLEAMEGIFNFYGSAVSLVVHAAAQPSHDYAASAPLLDFEVNSRGTLNLLEAARRWCPGAAFVHCSTNKVYGDLPNSLPFVENEARFEVDPSHWYAARGIDESMSIDFSQHSLFGCSKLAADVYVQEYGRYFGMNTAVFRGGTLTGPAHAGVPAHGFLNYLMRCAVAGVEYQVLGYRGKMVRDVIHASDVVRAFELYWRSPRPAVVYNIGGGRAANVSHLEAFAIAEGLTGRPMKVSYTDEARRGDHRWWISDTGTLERDYPEWKVTRDVPSLMAEMYAVLREES